MSVNKPTDAVTRSGPVGQTSGLLAEFEAVYRAEAHRITAFFARRGRDPRTVADLTADTFVEVPFTQVAGVDGVNERLAEWGARARAIAADPTCTSPRLGEAVVAGGPGVPVEVAGSRFLLQPGSIPEGSTLVPVVEQIDADRVATTTFEVEGQIPTCVPSMR